MSYPSPIFRKIRGRSLVLSGIILFIISTAFPMLASLLPAEGIPTWVGILDVITAVIVVLMMPLLEALAQSRLDDSSRLRSYRVYRSLPNLFLLLLVLFFLAGNQIRWEVLLPGLAWRIWVFSYVLPSGFAIWAADSGK